MVASLIMDITEKYINVIHLCPGNKIMFMINDIGDMSEYIRVC